VNPDLLLNAQKQFDVIEDRWYVSSGWQMGINPRSVRVTSAFRRSRDGQRVHIADDRASVYVGAYYANVAYGGPGDRFGALLGIEVPIIKDVFHFQADCITGNRDISIAVVGGVFLLPRKWQLSMGAQLPAPRSHAPYGFVLELTQPGFKFFGRERERTPDGGVRPLIPHNHAHAGQSSRLTPRGSAGCRPGRRTQVVRHEVWKPPSK